jgi:hypothetical protein
MVSTVRTSLRICALGLLVDQPYSRRYAFRVGFDAWPFLMGHGEKWSASVFSPAMDESNADIDPIRAASVISLAAFLGAVLFPYSSSNGGASLVHTAGAIGYNLGLFVVLVLCAALAFQRRTGAFSVALAIVALVWWLPGVVANSVGAVDGGASLRTGAYLAFVGVIALASEVVVGFRSQVVRVRVTRAGFVAGIVAGFIAIAWGVGEALPWDQDVYKSGVAGVTFTGSGASTYVERCCTLFGSSYSASQTTGYFLEISLIVVGAVFVCFLVGKGVSGIGLAALAITFSGEIVNGIQSIANSTPVLSDFYSGSALTKAASQKVSVTVSGLPGVWINLGAELALLIFGMYVFLASRIEKTPVSAT